MGHALRKRARIVGEVGTSRTLALSSNAKDVGEILGRDFHIQLIDGNGLLEVCNPRLLCGPEHDSDDACSDHARLGARAQQFVLRHDGSELLAAETILRHLDLVAEPFDEPYQDVAVDHGERR